MGKLAFLVLLVAAGGGWYFFTHYQVDGLDGFAVNPLGTKADSKKDGKANQRPNANTPPAANGKKAIRIATVNLGPLDHQKLNRRNVVDRLVQLVEKFDIVALQDVRDRNRSALIQFVEKLNAKGRDFTYATTADTTTGSDALQYSAFLFDQATVQVGWRSVYQVDDPLRRFLREPLVASFIARGPPEEEAFTFTLINVHTDANRVGDEIDLLDDVFRAVRDNGSAEDDVILLGNLGVDDRHFGELTQVPNLTWMISGQPTTTQGTQSIDNILFDGRATREFTGRSGLIDLMGEFDVSIREAVEISAHLPVWAEFDVFEGGPGQFANRLIDSAPSR